MQNLTQAKSSLEVAVAFWVGNDCRFLLRESLEHGSFGERFTLPKTIKQPPLTHHSELSSTFTFELQAHIVVPTASVSIWPQEQPSSPSHSINWQTLDQPSFDYISRCDRCLSESFFTLLVIFYVPLGLWLTLYDKKQKTRRFPVKRNMYLVYYCQAPPSLYLVFSPTAITINQQVYQLMSFSNRATHQCMKNRTMSMFRWVPSARPLLTRRQTPLPRSGLR